jgi:predicted metal-dependent phosphoesterase TrpH
VRLDLHIHTTASDGAWEPAEVVHGARSGGLHAISVTDHDTVAGVAEAQEAGVDAGITVIAGCELSSTLDGRELHILGYGVDTSNAALLARGVRARARRRERMAEMVERLRAQGIEVDLETVEEVAGDGGMIGRPHLAEAMVDADHVGSVDEAFDRYIGNYHDAYVSTDLGSPMDAIEVISGAGGVAVWAHPPGDLVESLSPKLAEAGLRGLEAYRGNYRAPKIRRYRDLAKAHGLVVSGGSDWHNPKRNEKLGRFWSTWGQLRELLAELGVERR